MRENEYIPLLKLVTEKHVNNAEGIQWACLAIGTLACNNGI